MFEWLLRNLCKFRWWLCFYYVTIWLWWPVWTSKIYGVSFFQLYTKFYAWLVYWMNKVLRLFLLYLYEVTFMHTDTWHNHWTHIHEQCSKYNISRHDTDTPPHIKFEQHDKFTLKQISQILILSIKKNLYNLVSLMFEH